MKHYAHVLEAKIESQSVVERQRVKGEFMTFGQMVIALGGWQWPPAVAGAKRAAGKCALLGRGWLSRDRDLL